jgi:cytosol alanyl aminopeptidase
MLSLLALFCVAQVPSLRLPTDVRPTSVAIHATIVPTQPTMRAVTTLEVELDAATTVIWLNQTGLEFKKAAARFAGRDVAVIAKPEKEHFVALELASPIGPGAATLVLETIAPLSRREGQGAFAATEGGTGYVFTQFEAVGARRAFPLFDEPSFKVPWRLTLTVPKGLVAVSNTSPESERVDGAMKTITFARTRPMPSYLLAFGVGPFEFVDGGTAGAKKVPVRIIVPKGQAARAKWAAEVTAQAIEHLETWFGTPFPYEKSDQLAVVGTAFGGAMENPGLVTWSQGLLLASPGSDSISRRRNYLRVAIHELAHHWFGDLVTAAWWDDIWLNESFADFVESEVITAWKPEWDGVIDSVESRDQVMNLDALGSVRRIREPIVTHDDIANAFDDITYSKGASVLAMFQRWVGPEVFRAGVRSYLAKHAWKNATVNDFLSDLGTAAGRDVRGPFETFLEQPGFPLVTSELQCGADGVSVKLTQERYAALGTTLAPQSWKLPLCLKWDGGRQCTLLDTPSATVKLATKSCPTWLLPNEDLLGYFRMKPVSAALVTNPGLTMAERVGVARELSALVVRGELSVSEELALVAPAMASGNRALTEVAVGSIWPLEDVLPETSKAKLAAFVQHHFGAKAKALGFAEKTGEPEDDTLLRSDFIAVMGVTGDPTHRAQATKLARAWLASHAVATQDVAEAALQVAARGNEPRLYAEVLAALKKEPDRRTRRTLIDALSQFTETKLAKKTLTFALEGGLDAREAAGLYFGLSGHPPTRALAVDFVKAHYDALKKALPEEWEAYLMQVATRSCDVKDRAELEAFFKPRTTKALGGPREYANAMDSFDLCVAWRAKQVPEAVKYLDAWTP